MFVPYAYNLISCPACQEYIDVQMFGFCSGLGPPLLVCKCRCIIESGRREWVDFQSKHRIRFMLMTALYAVVAAFLGGMSVWIWFHFGLEGRDASKPFQLNLTDPAFLFGAIIWVILVTALQRYRVGRSLERKPTVFREAVPVRVSFWNIDFNLQLKLLALFVLLASLLTYLTRLIQN